jgi:hypothetical protein
MVSQAFWGFLMVASYPFHFAQRNGGYYDFEKKMPPNGLNRKEANCRKKEKQNSAHPGWVS